jgi:hypothetical protein
MNMPEILFFSFSMLYDDDKNEKDEKNGRMKSLLHSELGSSN